MELTLFVIVGAIAVIAAAMMLVSENAVYSALFLILNFACIAFLFLMLNAPFLAMVQITVYAGAIMVLFLFVIMLLGAERILPDSQPRFRWMTPVTVALALALLVTASVAIIDGDVDLIKESQIEPHIRAAHALDGMSPVDVYLDGDLLAEELAFGDSTAFDVWHTGRYAVSVYAAGADPDSADPLVEPVLMDLDEGEALTLVVVGRAANLAKAQIVAATEDVSFGDDSDAFRVVAVNGLPERDFVDVWDERDGGSLIIDKLAYGEASEASELDKGDFTIGLYPDGDESNRLVGVSDKFDAGTSVLMIFVDRRAEGNRFIDATISLETTANPSFGGPTHVGLLLFTDYVLPFEMVSLLLLVAMIGAIVLTHESLAPRRRMERRLANPPAALERGADGK